MYSCPKCKKVVCKEDRRRKQPYLVQNNAILTLGPKTAPRIKCSCGGVIILIKGGV